MPISDFVARLRARVGHELLLLPSVSAIILDDAGRVLLALHDNGMWAPPGGVVEPDEHPVDAVIREVREELAIEVVVRGQYGSFGGPEFRVRYANGDLAAFVISVYDCEIVAGQPTPDGDEISAARFVDRDEIGTLPMSRWTTVVLPEVFAGHPDA